MKKSVKIKTSHLRKRAGTDGPGGTFLTSQFHFIKGIRWADSRNSKGICSIADSRASVYGVHRMMNNVDERKVYASVLKTLSPSCYSNKRLNPHGKPSSLLHEKMTKSTLVSHIIL